MYLTRASPGVNRSRTGLLAFAIKRFSTGAQGPLIKRVGIATPRVPGLLTFSLANLFKLKPRFDRKRFSTDEPEHIQLISYDGR